ncbi:MAG: argininosuccinate synthase [Planctomycetota bacterium]|nr:argininosuccinate synthase [Planctomycetota bacterium]
MSNKVILAYSGSLETSVAIHWLKHRLGYEVITYSADIGGGEELSRLGDQAVEIGAVAAHISDLKKRFIQEYAIPALKARARYQSGYLLAAALSRPLIVSELVKLAVEEGVALVAHASSPRGNDQVRFQTSVAALSPDLQVIHPPKLWSYKTKAALVSYAKKHGIPVPDQRETVYHVDQNIWGNSLQCSEATEPWEELGEGAFTSTRRPEDAPDEAVELEVGFKRGMPVSLDGKSRDALGIIYLLNQLGGKHGVGRIDTVEDRLIGIKCRMLYEAPAATILYAGHDALQKVTLSRDILQFQEVLSRRYSELIYNGLWFSELRRCLDQFFQSIHSYVSGTVHLKLYKGNCTPTGVSSDYSLYSKKLASVGAGDLFDQGVPAGLAEILSLIQKTEAAHGKG